MSVHRRTGTKKKKKKSPTSGSSEVVAKPSSRPPIPEQSKNVEAKSETSTKKSEAPESGLRAKWHSLKRMIQNTWAEIKKITWPDWETTRNLTVLVIVMATFLGALLGGIDFILLRLFEAI